MRGGEISTLVLLGRWEEALQRPAELESAGLLNTGNEGFFLHLVEVDCARGEVAQARERLHRHAGTVESADVQHRAIRALYEAMVLRAEGRPRDALAALEPELHRVLDELGVTFLTAKMMVVEAIASAFEVGDTAKVEELLGIVERLRPGERPPFLAAHAARFRARLDSRPAEGESGFKRATAIFRELDVVFWQAVTQLEHGEWLVEQGRADEAEALLAEARETFERLEATPWRERANAVRPALQEATA
jgi:hypothetical protein